MHTSTAPPQPRRLNRAASTALTGLGLALLAALPAHAQNLVTNPGFENGLTGYTFSGLVFVDTAAIDAHTGGSSAGFSSVNSSGHLFQNIATTAGQTYNVSFFLDRSGSQSAEFAASFAGFLGADVESLTSSAYTQYSFTAVATGPSSVLQFDALTSPSTTYFLDDLSVTAALPAVPETSTTVSLGLLLALSLGGLVVAARRKKAPSA